MDFTSWWQDWFTRHPLKEPSGYEPAQYTAEVMDQVRALAKPASTFGPWFSWPRLVLATASVAVACLVVVTASRRATVRLADAVVQHAQVLATLDENGFEPVDRLDPDALLQDLKALDTMVLAQANSSDEQWLEQTLQLFNGLDEDPSENHGVLEQPGGSPDDDWLNELQLLDESTLSSSS